MLYTRKKYYKFCLNVALNHSTFFCHICLIIKCFYIQLLLIVKKSRFALFLLTYRHFLAYITPIFYSTRQTIRKTNEMEKKILLMIISLAFACSNHKSTNELKQIRHFHKTHKDVDFEIFKCFSILKWNQNRANYKQEYHITFYPNCQSNEQNALRGKVKFENNSAIFHPETLREKDLPPQLLERFYALKVSNLFYKNPNKLELTLHPNIRLLKDCENTRKNYTRLDNCWYYRIIK